jgi:hypothetical protein
MSLAPTYLRLSIQRALVGQISPKLYGVCVDQRAERIALTFYVAPDITDDERDDLTSAGAMVIGDYPTTFALDEQFIVVEDERRPLRAQGTRVLLQRGLTTV